MADADLSGATGPENAVLEEIADDFYPRGATCHKPEVKGLTIMVNSIYNGWRMEDVWLDK